MRKLILALMLALPLPAAASDFLYMYKDPAGDELRLTDQPCRLVGAIRAVAADGVRAGAPEAEIAAVVKELRAGTVTIDGKAEPACWIERPPYVFVVNEAGEVIPVPADLLQPTSITGS